ncbi:MULTISPECIES: sodium/glutamate symporter [Oceanimonas]|uniref:Sodium/glutamate symporter n=1 Tax=Oceanimonas doudoroffii TaxID=84158 RepID=A0A233RDB9_9GAMM|nr:MULTISPECIES: sodium/glutamate symporter [Oceanimonas]NHH99356.1 Sodium/glutamate symporter [Oceanimonas sp. MB9]OXY81398.1 sodium/glutamate symporter [Oceanimonas doudoroffii]
MNVMTFDVMTTTTLAALLLMLGMYLQRRIPVLHQLCVPAPVIGGFGFAVFAWLARDWAQVEFKFDLALQSPLMIAFFATVGLGGSLALLKKGGKVLGVYLVACWLLALMQNGIGIGIASALGEHPLLGLMAGAVSLEGGFGAAAAFGPEAEALGVTGATTAALAAATFGMVAGGLLGAPVARLLIKRHNVAIEAEQVHELEKLKESEKPSREPVTGTLLLKSVAVVLCTMVAGLWLSGNLREHLDIILPSYVGAMFVAIVIRNLNEVVRVLPLSDSANNVVGDFCLGIFLTMAMMSLKLWQLADLGGSLLVILAVQTLAIIVLAYFVMFRLMGGNYDAAVLCAGFVGHGLGATPNAVANMGAVCDRYRVFSHKAFIVAPLCGAVLIDIVAIPAITWCLNVFG